MKPILQFLLFSLLAVVISSCEKNELDSSNVDIGTRIHTEEQNEPDGNTLIREALIKSDELHITITASGCDGSRWTARLDRGSLAYSNPPQWFAKIEFVDNEDCEALVSRTFVFDLKPLRVKEVRKVNINLEGWSKQLSYTY